MTFILGWFLIPFSLTMLWKNEKKLVTYARVINHAKAEYKAIELDKPLDENELCLVSGTGLTVNRQSLEDHDFGASVDNSYRLIRTVEMYQWKETQTKEKEGDTEVTHYHYHMAWLEKPEDSGKFHEAHNHRNPNNRWPFYSSTVEANNITLGGFRLDYNQIKVLGKTSTELTWEDSGAQAIKMTSENMQQCGFSQFEYRAGSLYASACPEKNNQGGFNNIGDYRVRFSYNKCGETSVLAQQIKDDDGRWTFRKWNPNKLNVPFGQSTDAEADSTWGPAYLCYVCLLVNWMFKAMFEEVVNLFTDGKVTAAQYFADQEKNLELANKVIRPLGIVLTILGLYFIFAPVIAMLKFVPLVGYMLASVASFAAILFAIIVGGTASCFTIALAWIFFRPLIGIPLMALTLMGVYIAFLYNPEGSLPAGTI